MPYFSPEISLFAANDLLLCMHVQDSHLFLVAGSVTAVLVVVVVSVIVAVTLTMTVCFWQRGT